MHCSAAVPCAISQQDTDGTASQTLDRQFDALSRHLCRGLDTCPQTKVPLTSSRLAPDNEVKLRVLDWLKAKRTELQLQAGRPPPAETQLAPDDMVSCLEALDRTDCCAAVPLQRRSSLLHA